MSIAITHPFNSLDKKVQVGILQELQELERFETTFKDDIPLAIQYIRRGKTVEIGDTVRALVDAMNVKAEEQKEFQKQYLPWKKESVVLTEILPTAAMAAKGTSYAVFAIGGLTLWSFRNSKLLAAANGCACLALLLLRNSIIQYAKGMDNISKSINDLTVENRLKFSGRIDEHYEGMEKNIVVLRSYFAARKRALSKPGLDQGLHMLRQDISAIKELKIYCTYLLMYQNAPISLQIKPDETVDISKIKAFFETLERITHKAKKLAAAGTLMGVAYVYCAYLNRAYLMIIAGLTFTLINTALFSVARSYQIGAIAMNHAKDGNLLELFNTNVSGRFIPKAQNMISLQKAIVIPLDRIFRLIPS